MYVLQPIHDPTIVDASYVLAQAERNYAYERINLHQRGGDLGYGIPREYNDDAGVPIFYPTVPSLDPIPEPSPQSTPIDTGVWQSPPIAYIPPKASVVPVPTVAVTPAPDNPSTSATDLFNSLFQNAGNAGSGSGGGFTVVPQALPSDNSQTTKLVIIVAIIGILATFGIHYWFKHHG